MLDNLLKVEFNHAFSDNFIITIVFTMLLTDFCLCEEHLHTYCGTREGDGTEVGISDSGMDEWKWK
jgi:hypothetical protein